MNSPEEVLAQLRITPFGCWEWTRARHPLGYGQVYYRGRSWRAHRLIYSTLTDINITGRVLDHLCRNPPCCNPDHLEPVTQRENNARGKSKSALNLRKTHCKNGHELTPENTVKSELKRGTRDCLICYRARDREFSKKKKNCPDCGKTHGVRYMREHRKRVHAIRIT